MHVSSAPQDEAAVLLRNSLPADVDGIVVLSRDVYSLSSAYTKAQVAAQIAAFQPGQFVGIDCTGEVVAMSGSLLVTEGALDPLADWNRVTSYGTLATHVPCGNVLYGFETMVHPRWRRCGLGRALFRRRVDLARRCGALAFRGAARLSGYAAWRTTLTPARYLERVVRGDCTDPGLSWALANGFIVRALVPNYVDDDPDSLGWAAVVDYPLGATVSPTCGENHGRE